MLAIFPALIVLVSVLGLVGQSATQPLIDNLDKLVAGPARQIFTKTLPIRVAVTFVLLALLAISAIAAFAPYAANFASYNKTYGALASVVVFLVWLWISNIAILLGAELNAEVERGRVIAARHDADEEPFLDPRDDRKLGG